MERKVEEYQRLHALFASPFPSLYNDVMRRTTEMRLVVCWGCYGNDVGCLLGLLGFIFF